MTLHATVKVIAVSIVLCSAPAVLAATAAADESAIQGRVVSVAPSAAAGTAGELTLAVDSGARRYRLAVDEAVKLDGVSTGSVIKVQVDSAQHPTRVSALLETAVQVGPYQRLIAMSAAFVALLIFAMLVTSWQPQRFLIGMDGRYSNSQTQIVVWFGALAVLYFSAVVLRIVELGMDFVGGVGITANVIALTGLSALSFGGAKVITSQKVAADPTAKSNPTGKANLLTDLFQNDRQQADFGDVQMILITLAAVTIFLISGFQFLGTLWPEQTVSLPDLDTTLLSTFGVGQGAYLLKKAALKPGEG